MRTERVSPSFVLVSMDYVRFYLYARLKFVAYNPLDHLNGSLVLVGPRSGQSVRIAALIEFPFSLTRNSLR